MDFSLIISTSIIAKQAIAEIMKCNEITSRYGLLLSQVQAAELVETRAEALKTNGRIEFGGGVIDKLIMEFCDSPFIWQENYADILHELVELFYYYKNESLDSISDDELIALMKRYFDHNCNGSIELLQNRELEVLTRNIRYGETDYDDIEVYDPEEYYEYYDEEKWYE